MQPPDSRSVTRRQPRVPLAARSGKVLARRVELGGHKPVPVLLIRRNVKAERVKRVVVRGDVHLSLAGCDTGIHI